MQTMDGCLGTHTYITPYCNTHQSNFNHCSIYSEWSEIEDTIGTALQVAGGSMDRYIYIYINVWEDAVGCWFVLFG